MKLKYLRKLFRDGLFRKGRFEIIKYAASIVFVLAACVATMGVLFFTSMTSTAQYRVSDLEVEQVGTALHLTWDTVDANEADDDWDDAESLEGPGGVGGQDESDGDDAEAAADDDPDAADAEDANADADADEDTAKEDEDAAATRAEDTYDEDDFEEGDDLLDEGEATDDEAADDWDYDYDESDAAGYMVFLQENGERPQIFRVEQNECDISLDVLDREYRVTVTAMNDAGGLSAAVSKNIMTHKLKQEIVTEKEKFIGLKNKARDMEAEANSELTFSSSDTSVVEVSGDGIMSYINDGHARITITAAENDQYRSTRKTVPVTVYPDVLDTPVMKQDSKTPTSVTLSWKPVEYAKGYMLRKYDPARDKYYDYQELDGTQTKVQLNRDNAKYKLKATAMVAGDQIESDPSEEVKVSSASAKAGGFRSSHNLGSLNGSNLEIVTRIRGVGSASIPQSMSHVGDNYVVTYVNYAGTVGALASYTSNGKDQGVVDIRGMGHANGSTYNPNTGLIYTVKTHREIRSASCTAFDAQNGARAKDFTLPRVTSGIAYDETNNKYYLSKGNELYVCDSDFNVEKFIWKRIRYNHAQDIGGYNGIVMVCTWVGGNTSYIDLYRIKDGAYLGSYDVSIGEIESCFMDNKHLVILMNNGTGGMGDCILRTVDPVELP